jgi:predicted KAP-like P-loop ATPase
MQEEHPHILSSDKPVTDPKDDRLGYAPFAKQLAENICKMVRPEGLVIALYGPWGSGKSTLLEFIEHYLELKPDEEKLLVVRFNPWWFSGHEDLTKRFFDQLQSTLTNKWKKAGQALQKKLADFSVLISETSLPYTSIGKPIAKAIGPKQKDVPSLKKQIADELKNQSKRILIVIDDIDRLTAEEIRQLFRVIKAVADFPNVVYLLAFDKDVAVRALQEAQGIPGEEYLEKIIQVPLELPSPDKVALRLLFLERLNVILADTPDELFNQTYWSNIYFESIQHFIVTPRDIVRITNALVFTYPAVAGEVNPVDFIAIETIRVFYPFLYEAIRNNAEMFSGGISMSLYYNSRHNPANQKPFYDALLAQVDEEDRGVIRKLLIRIFPKLSSVWENTTYGRDFEPRWRKELRICSPEKFDIYFRLVIPSGSISNAELKSILALVSSSQTFGMKLQELANQKLADGTTMVRRFLELLEDYTRDEISTENICPIIHAFFDVGDKLTIDADKGRGFLDFGNDARLARLTYQLIMRVDEQKRFECLHAAILAGESVSMIVREVQHFRYHHDKNEEKEETPEAEREVSIEHLEELEKLAIHKVRYAAQRGTLLMSPGLHTTLQFWKEHGGEDEVKRWMKTVINDDNSLLVLLEEFMQKSFSQSSTDVVVKTHYRFDPIWLEPFTNIDAIYDRIQGLIKKGGLTTNQLTALKQFILEYNMRKQGQNPNNPDVSADE